MRKKSTLVLFFLLIVLGIKAQGLYNTNWYFGLRYGLNFSSGLPLPILNSTLPSVEASASISDSSGNLLFYTNGGRVWNKLNLLMPNGDTMFTNPTGNGQINWINSFGSSSTNGVIIIPTPGNSEKYFIFSQWGNCWCGNPFLDAIGYSIIDMSLDGGLGDVVQGKKNIPLQPYAVYTEKIAATKHGNGRDWWVIAHDSSNNFIRWLITPDSIKGPFIQSLGFHYNSGANVAGEICFSEQGDKLGIISGCGIRQLFQFDRCTGELNLLCDLSSNPHDCTGGGFDLLGYGCSFSPDGTKFYFSSVDSLWQCNLEEQGSCDVSLISSVGDLDSGSIIYNKIGQHQLAPDGKIYFNFVKYYPTWNDTAYKHNYIFYIENPDEAFPLCTIHKYIGGFGGNYISAFPNQQVLGMPNMPNYNLGRLEGSACDTLYNSVNEPKKQSDFNWSVYPNPATNSLSIVTNQRGTLEIINQLGQIVFTSKINSEKSTISTINFSRGIYFIQIITNKSISTKKIILQ